MPINAHTHLALYADDVARRAVRKGWTHAYLSGG